MEWKTSKKYRDLKYMLYEVVFSNLLKIFTVLLYRYRFITLISSIDEEDISV